MKHRKSAWRGLVCVCALVLFASLFSPSFIYTNDELPVAETALAAEGDASAAAEETAQAAEDVQKDSADSADPDPAPTPAPIPDPTPEPTPDPTPVPEQQETDPAIDPGHSGDGTDLNVPGTGAPGEGTPTDGEGDPREIDTEDQDGIGEDPEDPDGTAEDSEVPGNEAEDSDGETEDPDDEEEVSDTEAEDTDAEEETGDETEDLPKTRTIKKAAAYTGTRTVTAAEILNGLGAAGKFAVFADSFNLTSHMAGVIAARELQISGGQFGLDQGNGQVVFHTSSYSVEVEKQLAGDGAGETFRFGLFRKSGSGYTPTGAYIDLTTDENGYASGYFPGTFGSSESLYVFEVDPATNECLAGNGSFTVNNVSYTVTYPNGEEVPVIGQQGAVSQNISYAQTMKGSSTGRTLVNDYPTDPPQLVVGSGMSVSNTGMNGAPLVTGNGAYYDFADRKATVTSANPFPIDFSAAFSSLNALSSTLAQAKSTNEVKVVNVTATGSGFRSDASLALGSNDQNYITNTGVTLGAGQYLVFNIDCTNVSDYQIVQYMVNGVRTTGYNNDAAHRTIFNFYKRNGTSIVPYSGRLSIETADGTFLAPSATVSSFRSVEGSIIAKTILGNDGEIHQDTFTPLSKSAVIPVENTGERIRTDICSLRLVKSINGGTASEELLKLLSENGLAFEVRTGGELIASVPITAFSAAEGGYEYVLHDLEPGIYQVTETGAAPEGVTFSASFHPNANYSPANGALSDDALSQEIEVSFRGEYTDRFSYADTMWIRNGYEKTVPAEITLSAEKILKGGTLHDGQFSFLLLSEDREELQSASCAEDGSAAFSPVIFDEPGIYRFRVREDAPEGVTEEAPYADGLRYDLSEYEAVVTVTETQEDYIRTLTASAEWILGGKTADEGAVFTNEEIRGGFSVKKVHGTTGEPFRGADCTFSLTDADGEKEIRKIDANGQILFTDLAPGDYQLREEKAPERYERLTEVFKIRIREDGTAELLTKDSRFVREVLSEEGTLTIRVSNYLAVVMPQTGSAERLLVLIAGSVLILSGIAYLIYAIQKKEVSR